jgi:hypothetical protein
MTSFIRKIPAVLVLAGMVSISPLAVAEPVVVELFTSQGCSSCPPADALLGEVARKPNVVALAYHVDYWDDLGWKDRFSMSEATQRQQGYVRRLSRSGPFTPQAVVAGDTSFVGSNRAAMTKALAEKRDALAISLSKSGSQLQIRLSEGWREPMDLYVVSYLSEATTPIGRGENAHRSLKEFNIVRSFEKVARWNGKPQQYTVPLASFPKDATAVAALLQRSGQGAIAGAATLALR